MPAGLPGGEGVIVQGSAGFAEEKEIRGAERGFVSGAHGFLEGDFLRETVVDQTDVAGHFFGGYRAAEDARQEVAEEFCGVGFRVHLPA